MFGACQHPITGAGAIGAIGAVRLYETPNSPAERAGRPFPFDMLFSTVDGKDQDDTTTVTKKRVVLSSTGLKHSRRRSSSCNATFIHRSFAPSSSNEDALSSLISSLTYIADHQQIASSPVRRPQTAVPEDYHTDNFVNNISVHPGFRNYHEQRPLDVELQSDQQNFCPPPVAGYNTINAEQQRPKSSAGIYGNKPARRFKDKQNYSNLQSPFLKGVKRSRDLRIPDSFTLNPPRKSHGDDSIASIPLSTSSKVSRFRSPFKMFFSQGLGIERHHASTEKLPSTFETSVTASSSPEKEKDLRFSAFVVGRISSDFDRKESDTKTLSSASPSLRSNLNDNLIPSRRSSLRSNNRRTSRTSKDLKSLNIDQDLIEENNETVQRIRELQEQREKRQKEWRREARRAEKDAKRMSVPNPSPSTIRSTGSVRSSWHPKIEETVEPKQEEPPSLTASVNATDLLTLPAFVEVNENEPLTPLGSVKDEGEDQKAGYFPRIRPMSPAATPSIDSATRHRKRLSDSIKRVSSLRQPVSEDAKSITEEVEAFLSAPRLTQKIRHPRTGRTIAFSEVGDPSGFVVFCCVGMGLTRYVTSFYDEMAKTQKLRIITPDRPGVAETDAMPAERTTPLAWVDDVAVICTELGIEKFSLLAHSAGAIYALATALKMPQYVRGRIHLLAPWIPPSQLAVSGQNGTAKTANLPTSHKILSMLPTAFMKAANSRFLSATSASIEPRLRKSKKNASTTDLVLDADLFNEEPSLSRADMAQARGAMLPTPETTPQRVFSENLSAYQAERMRIGSPPLSPTHSVIPRSRAISPAPSGRQTPNGPQPFRALSPEARQKLFNMQLTHRTWSLATLNANPASDLVICLERRRPIGFRYTDITRAVVIHHGQNDARVPLENVKWLSRAMKRCELRVLETEGHGLMASATVMTEVLGEIGREWEDWNKVAKAREQKKKEEQAKEEKEAKERERGIRRGYPRW